MKEKGMTLIEVLITMAIAVVAGGLLTIILVNSTGLHLKQSSKLTQGLNVNDLLSKVRESIKLSNSVDAASTVSQLILKVPSIDSSNNIIPNTFDQYSFFLDSTNLRFTITPNAQSVRPASNQIMTTLAEKLTFKYLDNATPPNEVPPDAAEKVLIAIVLKEKSGAEFETITATSEAYLRND